MRRLAFLPALLLLTGCPPASMPGPGPGSMERAALVADRIEQNPQAAHIVLEAEGITPQEYRDWMFRIARDPDLTREFLASRAQRPAGRPVDLPPG